MPCTVLSAPNNVASAFTTHRYEPVAKKLFGVVMLRDLQPGTEAELVKVCVPCWIPRLPSSAYHGSAIARGGVAALADACGPDVTGGDSCYGTATQRGGGAPGA